MIHVFHQPLTSRIRGTTRWLSARLLLAWLLLVAAAAPILPAGGMASAAGTGVFVPHPTTPSLGVNESMDVALGDLDGDGDLDALVANRDDLAETVWVNDGAGTFTRHPTTPTFGNDYSLGVALGDLDGDGDLDAVLANQFGGAEAVWVNDGVGNFTAHPTTPSFGAGESWDVALGDIDGDGDLDALVANDEECVHDPDMYFFFCSGAPETVWVNDGAGNFTAHPTTPSFGKGFSRGLALGDLDGDGDLDAVVANAEWDLLETVWVNDGAGNFTAHPTMPAFNGGAYTNAVALGDIDGDRDLDALFANSYDGETVLVNDGTGKFARHATTPSFESGGNTQDVVLGDLDNDGDLDAFFVNAGRTETVRLNDGTGKFTAHPGASNSSDDLVSTRATLGDIDGDGDLDALVGHWLRKGVKVWLNVTSIPPVVDGDGDGVTDDVDNCVLDPNADQLDTDGDSQGNACDNDDDDDGISDDADAFPLDPTESSDPDGDGFGNNIDPDDDNDGLTDVDEPVHGTDPLVDDTDGDGIKDGREVDDGTDPSDPDSDDDDLTDGQEGIRGTNPRNPDTDGDGVKDGTEVALVTNPLVADTDGDGLSDGQEVADGTNPKLPDTDGDGINDAQDAFPLNASETADTDRDRIGNNTDPDDDNDNVPDDEDAFPLVRDIIAPSITVAAAPYLLWPPNHQYEPLAIGDFVLEAMDGTDGQVDVSDVTITKVTSDEAEDAPGGGDGQTTGDIAIGADGRSVQLRAERMGSGNGRVYTIEVKATDRSGNSATKTFQVQVPKSQNGQGAVVDAAAYTVNR